MTGFLGLGDTNYSIRHRLLLMAALLLLVFLGVMSLGLNSAFKGSVLSNAENALRNQVLLLMSDIDVIDQKVVVSELLSEARLGQLDSDLFAQISTLKQGVVWRSASLLDRELPKRESQLGDFKFFPDAGRFGKSEIYAMALNVEWETDIGDFQLSIQVAEKVDVYHNSLAAYQRQVGIWLLVLGVCLLALLLLLWNWALKPLTRVTQQVGEIEQGTRDRFDEDYPWEVSRLTQNLNQLLNSEQKRINHQKEVLGNLAHSLKTPLAVLRGLQYSHSNQQEVDQQLSSVQNIIEYQLQSAAAVGRRRFAKAIDIRPGTEQIISSLNKIYQEKNLQIELNIMPQTRFFGDLGDWMELSGNLLENACKWAQQKVVISVENKTVHGEKKQTILTVMDDGSGVDAQLKTSILQRGVRLDSQTPGHGLGLHIVKGIIEAYEGELSISDLQPQGSLFRVVLN